MKTWILFIHFVKEVVHCFWSRKLTTLALLVLAGWGITIAGKVNDQTMNRPKKEPKAAVTIPDSVHAIQRIDSLETFYQDLAGRVEEAECVVKNYQGDANLVMEKADDMVSQWLTISTVLVTLIIGLSVWNNYKQEHSYRESVEKIKNDIVRIRTEMEATEHINKMGSIMTCLNSLPDPLLTDSYADRKTYVKNNLSLMYDEYAAYVKLVVKDEETIAKDIRYLQLVLSALKISVLRSQSVFSDVMSNIAFYHFTSKLNEAIKSIHKPMKDGKTAAETLKDILDDFYLFRAELK